MSMSRSPCGERGLKCLSAASFVPRAGSLPVRGAWVEIGLSRRPRVRASGRSPCGERGLKSFTAALVRRRPSCRSPCGERGLKCLEPVVLAQIKVSLPVRGAWVEMYRQHGQSIYHGVAPRAGSVG